MNKIILGIALVFISFWSCHKSSQKLQEKIEELFKTAVETTETMVIK